MTGPHAWSSIGADPCRRVNVFSGPSYTHLAPGLPRLVLVRSASQTNNVDSIKQAGLSFSWTEWSAVVSNAASAPFDKAGFFCRYAEAVKEFLDNNDRINDHFLAAYPILSLDQNDGCAPRWFPQSRTHGSELGIADRLLDFLDEGREDQGCEVVPVQPQDAGCAIMSALDDFDHVDASTYGRLLGREKPPDDSPAAGDENEEDGRRPEGASGNGRTVVAGCAEPARGVQLSDWDIEQ